MTSKYASRKLYGEVVAGPGGAVMPEETARFIEKQLPSLPQECREMGFKRFAFVPKGMEIQEGERADISLISTDAVDRDFEVLIPGGADFAQFNKNPVVTFAHRYDELPVGRSLWVKRSKEPDGWLAKTQYTSRPGDWQGSWFPDAVYHLVKSGDLNGKSVGFIPTEMSSPEEKEIQDRPELAKVSTIIRKWLVLEYAVAPVQSNPDAFVVAVGKAAESGILVPDIISEEMGIYVPTRVPTLGYKQKDAQEPEVIVIQDDVTVEDDDEIEAKQPTADEMRADVLKSLKSIDAPKIVEDVIDRMHGRV